jgi:hypothetical protein
MIAENLISSIDNGYTQSVILASRYKNVNLDGHMGFFTTSACRCDEKRPSRP